MGCTCAAALSFISEQLGYGYEIVADKDWDTAWGRMKKSMTENLPVTVGPIPYTILDYNPRAGEELRGDHFCVLCGFDEEEDTVWVNDPDGFSYAPLSLTALRLVWQNPQAQCPILPQAPLGLIVKGKTKHEPGTKSLGAILKRAYRLMRGDIMCEPLETAGPPQFIFTGVPGERKLATDISNRFDGADSRRLAQTARRMQEVTFLQGTQAKADIAYFLRNWAERLSSKEIRKQLGEISEYYDTESTLYLEAVKVCSQVTKSIASNTAIDEPWNSLAQIIEEIVSIEEIVLVRLEQLADTIP